MVYVNDFGNHAVRKINASTGATITLAGNGVAGFVDGTGGPLGAARFFHLGMGIAFDPAGNLFVADGGNNSVRMVDAITGTTVTLAGNTVVQK